MLVNRLIYGLGCATLLGLPAQAEHTDAVCAVEQVIVCEAFSPCERSLPGAVNLPTLFKIDHANAQVVSKSSDGTDRTSPFASVNDTANGYAIFGVDEDHAWELYLNASNQRFTFSSPRENVAYVGFGICASRIIE